VPVFSSGNSGRTHCALLRLKLFVGRVPIRDLLRGRYRWKVDIALWHGMTTLLAHSIKADLALPNLKLFLDGHHLLKWQHRVASHARDQGSIF
jgi:hypothetical protein